MMGAAHAVTADQDLHSTIREIVSGLSRYLYPVSSEQRLEDTVSAALLEMGFEHERQHIESAADRFDLWLPDSGIVIELKAGGSFAEGVRQCARYSRLNRVHGVILATPLRWAVGQPPFEQSGKPISVAWLRPSLTF